jgi:hypothetical protein
MTFWVVCGATLRPPARLFGRFLHELHTSRGRKRKVRIFEPSRGSDTPLTVPLKNCRFLYRSLP